RVTTRRKAGAIVTWMTRWWSCRIRRRSAGQSRATTDPAWAGFAKRARIANFGCAPVAGRRRNCRDGELFMTETDPRSVSVEVSIDQSVATIALNRPKVRNAIDDAMRAELTAVLDRLSDDASVRAIVITGRGEGFCAGGDIAGMQERLKAPSGE